ncbi:MAG: cupin domain-containing protein [Bacteroidota bacterium]
MKHHLRALICNLVIALFVILASHARASAQDPITAGPNIYKMVFENERVRLLEVTFQPGDSIGVHSHPDHAVYALMPGSLAIYEVGGKPMEVTMKAGEAAFLPAQAHSAKNTGKTAMKVLVVELKEPVMKKEKMKMEDMKKD